MNSTPFESLFNQYPDVVSVNDLQTMLGIGKNTAYKLVNRKEIYSVRIGTAIRIPKCKIIEFLNMN